MENNKTPPNTKHALTAAAALLAQAARLMETIGTDIRTRDVPDLDKIEILLGALGRESRALSDVLEEQQAKRSGLFRQFHKKDNNNYNLEI